MYWLRRQIGNRPNNESPICLTTKKNGDFRLIHNLSQPAENSVNDFIDSKFCSVRYSSIDDAVKANN
jgi:hypothetical protein